jgi:hypothetical protein
LPNDYPLGPEPITPAAPPIREVVEQFNNQNVPFQHGLNSTLAKN